MLAKSSLSLSLLLLALASLLLPLFLLFNLYDRCCQGPYMFFSYVELFPASDMPPSARRIEFRSVSSSSSLLKLPSAPAKSSSGAYGRERSRLPPPNRSSRSSGLGRHPSHRHGPALSSMRRSPTKRERLSPTPVPKPVPLAHVNTSRHNMGGFSEGKSLCVYVVLEFVRKFFFSCWKRIWLRRL